MKAAVYDHTGGPEVFRYAEVPDPELRPNGVIIETQAIGVQGGDVLNRQEGTFPTAPHVVGYQASGVIRSVGERVETLSVGQRVVATMGAGSHAELFSVPARLVWPLPSGLSVEHAAAVPVEFGTAHEALFEFGRLERGETVLVQAGASGVGLAAIQMAKRAGATVFATASTSERLARLRALGLDHPINYTETDVAVEVRRLTEGRGIDLVVDPVGGAVLASSIAVLGYRGRISYVGQSGRDTQHPDVFPIMEKSGSLTGVFFAGELVQQPARTYAMVAGLLADVAAGELQVHIDCSFPLRAAEEAHRYIESRQAFGRVLLIP